MSETQNGLTTPLNELAELVMQTNTSVTTVTPVQYCSWKAFHKKRMCSSRRLEELDGLFKRYSDLRKRMNSFKDAVHKFTKHARDFAESGFYYDRDTDEVACFFCGLKMKTFNEHNAALSDIHLAYSPECAYVLQMQRDSNIVRHDEQRIINGLELAENAMKYPSQKSFMSRYNTYDQNCFPNQTVSDMARAGFFHAQRADGDGVICFNCYGGLHNWLPGEEGLVEHLRWFPTCEYIKQFLTMTFQPLVTKIMTLRQYATDHRVVQSLHTALLEDATRDTLENRMLVILTSEESLRRHVTPHSPPECMKPASETCKDEKTVLDELEAVKKHNEELLDAKRCKVCWDKDANTLVLPCAHLVLCMYCASQLHKCCVCRVAIQETVRVYKM